MTIKKTGLQRESNFHFEYSVSFLRMKLLSVLILTLCSFGALAAKLDNVGRGRQVNTGQPNFFGAGANAANAQALFGSVGGGYLPPVEDKECEVRTITNYETVTLPAQTITRPAPGPSVVYRTDVQTSYVTQRPQTIVNTVTDYSTVVSTVAQYNTITSTRLSTYVSTAYQTTTAYSTRYSTQVSTLTRTQSVTRTQVNTITRTLPASTNYVTNTITLPPRVTTFTSTRLSTMVQYSTIYSTQVQVSTYSVTSTLVSTAIRPTTIYDVDTTTQYSTQYITTSVQGPTRTVTQTEPAAAIRTPEPYTVTETQPCATQVQTGYQYSRPAVPFNF